MGAVHGVYLKYVGLSAVSYAGYSYLTASGEIADLLIASGGFRNLLASATTSSTNGSLLSFTLSPQIMKLGAAAILRYSSILNGLIAFLFKLEKGMGMIGKDPRTGQIPLWSYVLYFPFHLPSILYTRIHANNDRKKKVVVPVASEVQPGWWVGGTYSNELNKEWGGVIDLTVEFPERCFDKSKSYLLCAVSPKNFVVMMMIIRCMIIDFFVCHFLTISLISIKNKRHGMVYLLPQRNWKKQLLLLWRQGKRVMF